MNFFDFVKVGERGKDVKLLVMMVEVLLLLSLRKKKKEWEIETKKIRRVERENDAICVVLKEKNKRIEVFICFFFIVFKHFWEFCRACL